MEKYLSKEQMQIILDSRPKGVPINDALDMYVKNGWTIQGVNEPKTTTQKAKDIGIGFAKGVGRTVASTASGIQDIGQGTLGLITGEKAYAPEMGIDTLKRETPQGQALTQSLQPTNEDQKLGGQLETGAEFLAGGGAQLAKAGIKAVTPIAKNGLEALSTLPKNISKKAIDFVSADPEKKVENILKRSTPEDVDYFAKAAEKASISGEAATPFELTGEKLAGTTKILQKKLGEIGKAKSEIIQPMREGLDSFKAETKPLIEKLNSLKNSFTEIDAGNKNIVDAIVKDAKTVSTKMDADKFIDKLQDAIYTGNTNQTIARGSALDKQLRGLIGEYNSSLKKSLPKEYGELNEQYSKLIDNLDVINRSLGEVVDGVPVRGASLIKQFFSPSGTKAKEIFEFIKKETNGEVDLAKDATLSKFMMEIFEDPRARSLLQGIGDVPTTIGGAVGKVIEKVGGDKLQSAMRKSTIRKAKGKAVPK